MAGIAKDTKALGHEGVGSLLLRFSAPAITAMMVGTVYITTDRWFISQYVGEVGIAALVVMLPLYIGILALEFLTGNGGSTLFSIRLGEDRPEEAERILGNTLVLQIILSAALALGTVPFIEPILRLLGASEDVLPMAKAYSVPLVLFSVLGIMGYGLNSFIRAAGYPGWAMMTTVIGALSNIVFDYMFIVRIGLGMMGAALASVLSWGILLVFVLSLLSRRSMATRLRLKNLRPDLRIMTGILKFGISSAVLEVAFVITMTFTNIMLRRYGGDIALSAWGVASTIWLFTFRPIFGLGQAMSAIIAYNFGAKKPERVRHALRLSLVSSTAWMLSCMLVILLFGPAIIGMFMREGSSPELSGIAAHFVRVMTIPYPVISLVFVASSLLPAIGEYKKSLWFNLTRELVIYLPLILVLPHTIGMPGVMSAIVVSELVCSCLGGALLWHYYRSLKKGEISRTLKVLD